MITTLVWVKTRTKERASKMLRFFGLNKEKIILTENGLTPKEEQEILRRHEEMKKGINCSGPMTTEEFIRSLKGGYDHQLP